MTLTLSSFPGSHVVMVTSEHDVIDHSIFEFNPEIQVGVFDENYYRNTVVLRPFMGFDNQEQP